ncbi:alpha/beta hydrolase [Ruegeria litorea]|uniref:Alpha/beta hydrolase n=1 Tax=Falsiruegeria litorea TaxID=1280831 RepID=A0ABS5WLG7_9RHOB|nr:alpha/beta fold hydrolase [Falsiruegeria litorea]MBT3139499.1 alpha/beta hydrolase [Falsiruegeria litorea]
MDTKLKPKMSSASVLGTKVRYLIKSSNADTRPLLICNGLGQSIEILFPLMEELEDRTVIAFDVPGVGRSEVNHKVGTIPDYADFTLDLMSQIGVQEFDILGISWGGAVAQQMARNAPDRVGKLVLAITSAGGIGSWWGTPLALSEVMFPLRFVNKAYGNFIGPWMYGGETALNPGLFKQYSKHAIKPTSEGYFTQVRAMCGWTSLPWLSCLKQPTLILAGQFDGLIPIANQVLLAQKIRNARLHVFPSDHLLMYTRRQEVGALMRSFLA